MHDNVIITKRTEVATLSKEISIFFFFGERELEVEESEEEIRMDVSEEIRMDVSSTRFFYSLFFVVNMHYLS